METNALREKKKVLVVEDEDVLAESLSDNLEAEGFRPLRARNGEEGLFMCFKAKPDLILLDLLMPKVDGVTMLKELHKDPWGKKAVVIVLTNLDTPDKISQIAELASDYLVKSSWSIEDVLTKVKEKLKPQV